MISLFIENLTVKHVTLISSCEAYGNEKKIKNKKKIKIKLRIKETKACRRCKFIIICMAVITYFCIEVAGFCHDRQNNFS